MPTQAGPDLNAVSFPVRQAEKALGHVFKGEVTDDALRLFTIEPPTSYLDGQVWGRLRGTTIIEQRSVEVWISTRFAPAAPVDDFSQLEVVVMPHGGGQIIVGLEFCLVLDLLEDESPELVRRIKRLAIAARAKVLSHHFVEHVLRRS